jgi:hypothetical protein
MTAKHILHRKNNPSKLICVVGLVVSKRYLLFIRGENTLSLVKITAGPPLLFGSKEYNRMHSEMSHKTCFLTLLIS